MRHLTLPCGLALCGLALGFVLLRAAEAGEQKEPNGDAVIKGRAGPSDIVITTSARAAGAIQSLKWHGKEFVDSSDHGRLLQSAAHFDAGLEFAADTFKPTEAGARRDGSGDKSSSKLLSLKAAGNELSTKTQMAFWLAPWEKTDGRFARNDAVLSEHIVAKRIRIGHEKLPHAIECEATFTVPKGEFHKYAQFEALACAMPAEFSEFRVFDVKKSDLAKIDDGPGEQPHPIVVATADGKYAIGVYSPDQRSKAYEKLGYGLARQAKEKIVRWHLVFRHSDDKGIGPGDYRFRAFLAVGGLEEVRNTLSELVKNVKDK